ncbi:hypothetical protein BACCIP111895_01360 [Neobacillus rhizosphaerae]|uniref:Bypass of forespore C C-terminal domain-containing protein n=1 Tax=Neobacillus rhizosphaerae TaxID=2880965 RepID=A0ABM9ENJ5_9BACI|nr:hypothetical protein [Neobacillus rhizosphaerae]CAH2714199.1 hypothetical protein BACCIP111895_01360 [Neobacillus rhizosphaerae]
MLAKSKKAKWTIGLTGTALSAFVISQIGGNQPSQSLQNSEIVITKSMSKQEKEFVQLDWSNYEINGVVVSGGVEQSDRQSRRS